MFDLEKFVNQCVEASLGDSAVADVRSLLNEAVADIDRFKARLPPIADEETLLHHCDRLTMVNLRLTPNVHYPPHNHNMPVVMAIWGGSEINTFYDLKGDDLVKTGEAIYMAGDVPVVTESAIHSVVNDGHDYSNGLHVYLEDLLTQERHIWHPQTFDKHPYSDDVHFQLSQSFRPDCPFNRPQTCYAHS